MKVNHLIYHAYSDTELILSTATYSEVKDLIPYATVTHCNDLVLLELVCHKSNNQGQGVIRNGQLTLGFDRCSSCKHRLRKYNNSCGFVYESIKSVNSTDFSFVISHLRQRCIQEDQQLMGYCQSYLNYDESHEENIKDMPYREYQALIHFFEKVNHFTALFIRISGFLKRNPQ